jgi:hypothetical protein
MPTTMYRTRDNRRVLFMNIYPGTRTAALAFLGCNDNPTAVGSVIRQWTAFDLEEQANRAGLQATVVRCAEEFLATDQCRYLENLPLVHIEKIAEGDPEPFSPHPARPLGAVRALGFSHLIAEPGHGARARLSWSRRPEPVDAERLRDGFQLLLGECRDAVAIMDLRRPDEMARFRRLLAEADIFFANRRPGLMEKLGITTDERPGIVQVDFSIYGAAGPGQTGSAMAIPQAASRAFWRSKARLKNRSSLRSSSSTTAFRPGLE